LQRVVLALLLLLGGCWEVSAQGSKPSFITRELLELRLKALERDREQAIANVNAYDGAIQECQFWLELLKDEEEEAMIEFPKWKYHKDGKAQLVKSAEEEEALGPGWADSPAAFQTKPAPMVDEQEAEALRRRVREEVAPPPLSEEPGEEEKPKDKKKKK
jgi:hypothetical protein